MYLYHETVKGVLHYIDIIHLREEKSRYLDQVVILEKDKGFVRKRLINFPVYLQYLTN